MLPYLSPEAPFAILLMLAAAAMIFKPLRAWRRSLVNTGVFFAACLVGDLLAGLLDGLLAPTALRWLRELAVFGEGLAVIRYAGLALFEVVLPRLRMHISGILADILVIVGYIAWGFLRLNLAGVEFTHLFATSAVLTAVLAISMQDTLGNLLGGRLADRRPDPKVLARIILLAALLTAARAVAKKRVVVKRPRLGDFLAQAEPAYQYAGKSTRFDVYLPDAPVL